MTWTEAKGVLLKGGSASAVAASAEACLPQSVRLGARNGTISRKRWCHAKKWAVVVAAAVEAEKAVVAARAMVVVTVARCASN